MTLLEAQCEASGLSAPVREYVFAKPRKWRIDFAWIDRCIALEQEGGVWIRGRHTRGKGYLNDLEKYNELAARGWLLIRVTPDQMARGEAFLWVERAWKGRG